MGMSGNEQRRSSRGIEEIYTPYRESAVPGPAASKPATHGYAYNLTHRSVVPLHATGRTSSVSGQQRPSVEAFVGGVAGDHSQRPWLQRHRSGRKHWPSCPVMFLLVHGEECGYRGGKIHGR